MRGFGLFVACTMVFAGAALAQPANDQCASATEVFPGLPAATGTNVGATNDGPTPSCVGSNGPDVWYRYVTTAGSGQVIIDTCGSTFDTILTVYLGACPGGSAAGQIACDDDGATCGPQPFRQSRVTITPTPGGGDVLFIRVHGFSGATGNIVLNINRCAPAVVATTGGGSTCGQAFRTVGVTAVGLNPTYQWFFESLNAPIPDTNSPELTVPVSGVGPITYICRVTTACGTAFSPPITFNNNEFPVFTTNLPTNLLACSGQPTTLEVATTGGDNSFQWKRGQDPIPGATGPTYAIDPIDTNSGLYSCVVTNSCGSNTSQVCNVVVNGPTLTVGTGQQFGTIQAAINALPTCGRVLVSPGTYIENLNLGGRKVRLESTDGPSVTIIDGSAANAATIQSVDPDPSHAGSLVRGFTILGGRGAFTGAITFGGGIAVSGPGSGDPFIVEDCIIRGNRANYGGGIAVIDANLRLANVQILENFALGNNPRGGGLALIRASVSADRCSFFTNIVAGGSGGAVSIEEGTPAGSRLSNCLIALNLADVNPTGGGGGIRVGAAGLRLLNCTIAGNSTPGGGSALRLESLANVSLANCVIAANSGGSSPVFFLGAPPLATYCCIQPEANIGAGGIGNIVGDPQFVRTASGNFRLGPNSPCIDAGSASANTPEAFALDLDGAPRVVDDPARMDTGMPGPGTGTQDIGAYERGASPTDPCPQGPLYEAGSYSFSSIGAATDGPNEAGALPCSADSRFLGDVWLRYAPACDGTATIGLCGSTYDTQVAVYRGDACPSAPGQVAACNDDSDCGLQSFVSLSVTAGEMLLIRIAGFNGAAGTGTVTLACNPACAADYNGDGNLDPDDLADYIACYFSAPPCDLADFNNDMNADPDDLADFIAAFFGGCG